MPRQRGQLLVSQHWAVKAPDQRNGFGFEREAAKSAPSPDQVDRHPEQ